MMKGIAFTIDAIFALVIASAAISILLYFQFVPQTPFLLKAADAQNLVSLLLSTNVSSLSSSSPIVYAMANQQAGALSGWDSYGGGAAGQRSSGYGVSKPFIAATITAPGAVTTGIVADYGNVYFGTAGGLYAYNKSGELMWSNTTAQPLTTPALFNGQLIYWTSSNIYDLNAVNGSVVWSSNALGGAKPSAPIVQYRNELVLATTNNNLYVVYDNNGSVMSTNSLTGNGKALSIAQGSIAAVFANTLALYTNSANVAAQGSIWSNSLSTTLTNVAVDGNELSIGVGSNADLFDINGTRLASLSAGSTVSGAASSGNNIVFQSSGETLDLSLSGCTVWTEPIPARYGSALGGTSPVIGQGYAYSLWSNQYLVAQNLSSGSIQWSSKLPFQSINPNMTIAYGRLFVAAGANVIEYGSCNQNAQTSIFQASASLYLNGEGSCADYLLNSVEPMGNYTLAYGSNVMSGLSLAGFSSNAYAISGGNYTSLPSLTIAFWAYPTKSTGGQEDMVDSIPRYWMVGFNSANYLLFNPGTSNTVTTSNAVPYKKWDFIAITAQTSGTSTTYSAYMNGVKLQSNTVGQNIQAINSIMFSNATNAYNGLLADVQVYNTSLSGAQLGLLYQQGLQGGPLSNLGLLSWYPLDGDANDYGNQSDAAYGVGITWQNGNYVPQGLLDAYEVGRATSIVALQNYTSGTSNLYNIGVDAWR